MIPVSDAVEALTFLCTQQMLDEKAREYALLPAVYLEKRFNKIRDDLKILHRIMQNRQPEKEIKFTKDQGPDVNFGEFGLAQKFKVDTTQVRNYLIYKFKIKIWTLEILTSYKPARN